MSIERFSFGEGRERENGDLSDKQQSSDNRDTPNFKIKYLSRAWRGKICINICTFGNKRTDSLLITHCHKICFTLLIYMKILLLSSLSNNSFMPSDNSKATTKTINKKLSWRHILLPSEKCRSEYYSCSGVELNITLRIYRVTQKNGNFWNA
jgi:hypothetical protein